MSRTCDGSETESERGTGGTQPCSRQEAANIAGGGSSQLGGSSQWVKELGAWFIPGQKREAPQFLL